MGDDKETGLDNREHKDCAHCNHFMPKYERRLNKTWAWKATTTRQLPPDVKSILDRCAVGMILFFDHSEHLTLDGHKLSYNVAYRRNY